MGGAHRRLYLLFDRANQPLNKSLSINWSIVNKNSFSENQFNAFFENIQVKEIQFWVSMC